MIAAVVSFLNKIFVYNDGENYTPKSELEILTNAYREALTEYKQAYTEVEKSGTSDENYIWLNFLSKREKLNKIIIDIKEYNKVVSM